METIIDKLVAALPAELQRYVVFECINNVSFNFLYIARDYLLIVSCTAPGYYDVMRMRTTVSVRDIVLTAA